MNEESTKPLPDFECPPVIEVAYGIQFSPLRGFQSPSIGLFWQRIREEYPKVQEMPMLAPVIEGFEKEGPLVQARLELLETPPLPRVFFVDLSGNWVLQLQNDRFLHNWRKVTDADVYPRFPKVSRKFFDAWNGFLSFCREEGLSLPSINQLELTYINHIPVSDTESLFKEVHSVFPDVKWRDTHQFLPNPETLAWKTSFVLPDQRGRLHVSLRHALRRKEREPVLLLELTARGMSAEHEPQAIERWFRLSREWIVRGFADLSSERIQRELWGRRA